MSKTKAVKSAKKTARKSKRSTSKAKSGSARAGQARAITGHDLQAVREMYGLNSVDLTWLIARPMHTVRLSEAGGAANPLRDRRLAILIRILEREADPDIIPMPQPPKYEDMFEKLGKQWPPREFEEGLPSGKREKMTRDAFGMLFGVSLWSSYAWGRGAPHDPIVDRLFWVVDNLFKKHGAAAIDILAEVVDEEARARGIKGGLPELMRVRRWGSK